MSNLAEETLKNSVTKETEEKKSEAFTSREARLRNQKHLEMAYEWLRNRGKRVESKGAVENL